MNTKLLAYKLAYSHGYTYHRTPEFRNLTYAERVEVSDLIFFILEQEN